MSTLDVRSTRRALLLQLSALGITSAIPGGLTAQSTLGPDTQIDFKSIQQLATGIPNPDTLLKFNKNGTPKPFAGNTVICHVPVQCDLRDAMVGLHKDLAHSVFVHKLGLTSTDSYHMTVFPGANDQGREIYGWPAYVPIQASIEECNRAVGEKMAAAQFACRLPLKVRVDEHATLNYFSACTLRMVPANQDELAKLRALRDQLAEVYGFRLKDHEVYEFHITLCYQLAPFTAKEQLIYRNILRSHLNQIVAAAHNLELGEPEYCVFADMFRFEPKVLLACR